MEFEIKRIQSKPADAVQFDADIIEEVVKWTGATNHVILDHGYGLIVVLQNDDWTIEVYPGDWLIKGDTGEVYKAAPGPFAETFIILEEQS